MPESSAVLPEHSQRLAYSAVSSDTISLCSEAGDQDSAALHAPPHHQAV